MLTIKGAAEQAGLTAETIRCYEKSICCHTPHAERTGTGGIATTTCRRNKCRRCAAAAIFAVSDLTGRYPFTYNHT